MGEALPVPGRDPPPVPTILCAVQSPCQLPRVTPAHRTDPRSGRRSCSAAHRASVAVLATDARGRPRTRSRPGRASCPESGRHGEFRLRARGGERRPAHHAEWPRTPTRSPRASVRCRESGAVRPDRRAGRGGRGSRSPPRRGPGSGRRTELDEGAHLPVGIDEVPTGLRVRLRRPEPPAESQLRLTEGDRRHDLRRCRLRRASSSAPGVARAREGADGEPAASGGAVHRLMPAKTRRAVAGSRASMSSRPRHAGEQRDAPRRTIALGGRKISANGGSGIARPSLRHFHQQR